MKSHEAMVELLTEIRDLLAKLAGPVVALESEQLAKATPGQRKAHNKAVLAQTLERMTVVKGRAR